MAPVHSLWLGNAVACAVLLECGQREPHAPRSEAHGVPEGQGIAVGGQGGHLEGFAAAGPCGAAPGVDQASPEPPTPVIGMDPAVVDAGGRWAGERARYGDVAREEAHDVASVDGDPGGGPGLEAAEDLVEQAPLLPASRTGGQGLPGVDARPVGLQGLPSVEDALQIATARLANLDQRRMSLPA